MTLVVCRDLNPQDRESAYILLNSCPPVVAGLTGTRVNRAILDYSLSASNCLILLAEVDSSLAGYVIVAWDWNHFKSNFALTYPLLSLKALLKKLIAKLTASPLITKPNAESSEAPTAFVGDDSPSWQDSDSTIAKILFIGVSPAFRSLGIGSQLYNALFIRLKDQSVSRVDAHIDATNTPSLKMHIKSGWDVKQDEQGYFAWKRL